MTVAGLVLAAGEGRRLGRPKALLELDGERLVDRAVRVLREGGCEPVYVVAGAAPLPGLVEALVVENPGWPEGMGSSLRRGLAVLGAGQPEAAAAVVLLVDTPGIGPGVVRRLVAAFTAGASVAASTYDGKLRNPVLLGREHWAQVSSLAVGDVGARAFLAARPELVRAVECGDIADPADLDTPEDLVRFTR